MPSYEQNKNSKLWSVRFREIDVTGETHQKRLSGFPTKKAAQYGYQDYLAKKAEEEAAKIDESPEDPDDMYFETLVNLYFRYEQGRVKSSTYYDLESKIGRRILPAFKGLKIKEIKPIDVLEWQNSLMNELSTAYISHLCGLLTAIYRYGEKYHDITNVMTKVDKPRNTEPKREMEIWSPEEFAKFIATVEDPTYKMFFTTLYLTGCRRGEAAALTWSDVDLKKSKIKISKSVTKKSQTAAWELTTPKNTSSNRTVTMPPSLCKMLSDYKKQQHKTDPEAVFLFGASRPLPERTTDRFFENACENANIKKIRIHDLRHSCASLLLSKGVSIVAVSRQLGHANVTQTLNTYAHLMPDDQSKTVAELEEIGTMLLSEK